MWAIRRILNFENTGMLRGDIELFMNGAKASNLSHSIKYITHLAKPLRLGDGM